MKKFKSLLAVLVTVGFLAACQPPRQGEYTEGDYEYEDEYEDEYEAEDYGYEPQEPVYVEEPIYEEEDEGYSVLKPFKRSTRQSYNGFSSRPAPKATYGSSSRGSSGSSSSSSRSGRR